MKKVYLLFIAVVLVSSLTNAQYKLSSSTNAFIAGDNHDFVFVTASGEGNSGKNVVWDYTGIVPTSKTLTTHMYAASGVDKAAQIPQANMVIEEAGNLFFFKVGKDGMEQFGSASGCALTRYDKPMVKLIFPFKYSDKVSGEYSGVIVNQNNTETKISGTYEVVADAFGTLLLPGNVTIKNVVRVKQTRTFTGSDQKEITYRWYSREIRYPLLVVIKYESLQKSVISETALYAHYKEMAGNENQTLEISKLSTSGVEVFPNPADNQITLKFKLEKSGKVKVDLIDSNGKLVKTCINRNMDKGLNSETILLGQSYNPGTYYLRITSDENVITQKIIRN